MRRFFLSLSLFIFVYFLMGFYLATFNFSIFKPLTASKGHPYFYDYKGATHVATSFSKGSEDPSTILLEASEAKLNFLFFTDLNLMGQPYKLSGYHGDVYTFTNQKISYMDSHVLIYTDQPDFHFSSLTEAHAKLHNQLSSDIDDSPFVSVLAHPYKPHHLWTGPYPSGLNGIEVINLRQLWQEGWVKDKLRFAWSLVTFPFNPTVSLFRLIREPQKELRLWDQLNQDHKTVGFLGNEATARNFKVLGLNFTFLSYLKSFEFASNHLLLSSELTGHAPSDRQKIFRAISKGQFYMAFDSLGSPLGFATYAVCNGERLPLGSEFSLKNKCNLQVDLPDNLRVSTRIELFRNGEFVHSEEQRKLTYPIKESGNYRVVVKVQPPLPQPDRRRWFSWIFTNNLYVKD